MKKGEENTSFVIIEVSSRYGWVINLAATVTEIA
jgi:hypothetical protein